MNWPATPCQQLRPTTLKNVQRQTPLATSNHVHDGGTTKRNRLTAQYQSTRVRICVQRLVELTPDDGGVDFKDKMSRALGAAYLGHQVAKLESRINSADPFPSSRGGSPRGGGRGRGARGGSRAWTPERNGQRPRKRSFTLHPIAAEPGSEPQKASIPNSGPLAPVPVVPKEKPIMANVIVLDASVLVYALGQVKRWCKEERKETLIVPLEGVSSLRSFRIHG